MSNNSDSLRQEALTMLSDLDIMLCNVEQNLQEVDSSWLVCICPFLDCLVSIANRLLTFLNSHKK